MEEGTTTNYTRTLDRNSLKIEEVELEREKSLSAEDRKKQSPGSNICDAITRAMNQVSKTKKNWLKPYFYTATKCKSNPIHKNR